MKIDETQPHANTHDVAELQQIYAALGKGKTSGLNTALAGFDGDDFGFFDMLTALEKKGKGLEASALDLMSPMGLTEEEAAKTLAQTTVNSVTSKQNDSLLNTVQASLGADATDAKSVKKDLEEMMGADMTAEDLAYLKSINPHALPIAPPVPLNQLIPVDDEGKPQFERIPASKGLSELLAKAYKTGRPIRVELENGGSVILKIKEGKVSAEFIATDQANAMYLKQQLAELRQRMEAKNLPVGQLEARKEDSQRQKRDSQGEEDDFQHGLGEAQAVTQIDLNTV